MATIEELQFSGIRSFPPEVLQCLGLKNKTLCIVQGMNGCGKTTIVECFKFAITGSLPPNSNNGQSFVQDPKISGSSEVQGRINVKFRTGDGRKVIVQRKVKVKQNKSKLTFSQQDALVKTRANGKVAELNSKCAEVDKIIPDMLKVSKPILENVIFCHQEDSLWPLQESSVLKKKFDDIFESTRYNKALEEVKKQRKKLSDQAKNHLARSKVLDVHKTTFHKLNVDRGELELKIKANEEARKEIKQRIDRTSELVADLERKKNEFSQDIARYESVKQQSKQLRKYIKAIRNEMLEEYTTDVQIYFEDDKVDFIREKISSVEQSLCETSSKCQNAESHADILCSKIKAHEQDIANLNTAEAELARGMTETETKISLEEEQVRKLSAGLLEWYMENENEFKDADISSIKTGLEEIAQFSFSDQKQDFNTVAVPILKKALSKIKYRIVSLEDVIHERSTKRESQRETHRLLIAKLESDSRVKRMQLDELRVKKDDLEVECKALDAEIKTFFSIESNSEKLKVVDKELISAETIKSDLEQKVKDGYLKYRADDMSKKLKEIQTSTIKEREKLIALQRDHDKVVRFQALGRNMRDWIHRTLNSILSGLAENLNIEDLLNDPLNPSLFLSLHHSEVHVILEDLNTDDGFTEVSNELERRMRTISSFVNLLNESSASNAEAITSIERDMRGLESKLVLLEAKRVGLLQDVMDVDKRLVELENQPLTPKVSLLLQNNEMKRNIESYERVHSIMQSELEHAREDYEATAGKAKVWKALLLRAKETSSCPCCHRAITDAYPTEAIPVVYPAQLRTNWFDIQSNGDVLMLQDVKFNLNNQSGNLAFEFEKGKLFKGLDVFLAQMAAKASHLTTSNEVSKKQEEFTIAKNEVESLQQLKTIFYEFPEMSERAQNLKEDQLKLESEIHDLKQLIEVKRSSLTERQTRKSLCGKAIDLLSTLAGRIEDGLRTRNDIMAAAQELRDTDGFDLDEFAWSVKSQTEGRTTAIMTPLEITRLEIDRLNNIDVGIRQDLAENQSQLDQLKDAVSKARDAVHELKSERNNIVDLISNKTEKERRRSSVLNELQSLEATLEQTATDIRTIEKSIESETSAFEKIDKGNEAECTEIQKILSDHKNIFLRISSGIQNHVAESDENEAYPGSKSLYAKLRHLAEERKKNRSEFSSLQSTLEDFKAKLNDVQSSASNIDSKKRMYEKLLRLFAKYLELEQLIRESERLKKISHNEFIKSDGKRLNLDEEIETETDRFHEDGRKLARLKGIHEQLYKQLQDVTQQLSHSDLHNIVHRHRESAVSEQTASLAAIDLDKYYNALDTALMQFHQQKIEEINRNVNQLWLTMYRGGDIDSIELRSEKTIVGKNRSYNYRVVMTKADTQLDMRGRCSAGQKVLASLVIRMALAQSFSASISFLALDEPTTNLDEKNKQGLATSLGSALLQFPKMQLIVITHDDDFVQELRAVTDALGKTAHYTVQRNMTHDNKWVSRVCNSEEEEDQCGVNYR